MPTREEGNHLDLNNLPDDHRERSIYREGKQVLEENSTASTQAATDASRIRKKKNGGKDGKDESDKVYKCRFCSLKFCKSQALGGHMNRHRQERETETLNRARQLVFSNEGLAAQGPPSHLGCSAHTFATGNFHQRVVMGEPAVHLGPLYTTRLPSPSSLYSQPQQSPLQPNMYPSSSRLSTFHPSYTPPPPPQVKDYYIGQVIAGDHAAQSTQYPSNHHYQGVSNYPCMGAPVGHGFNNTGAPSRDQVNGQSWD